MENDIFNRNYMSYTSTGGFHTEERVFRSINFDRYTVMIELAQDGKFLNIFSIKLSKSFIQSVKNNQRSDVHDVDEFYIEE